jgi:hypothetical protein
MGLKKFLQRLDRFSSDPNVLRFGDPNEDKDGKLSRSWLGGALWVVYAMGVLTYLSISIMPLLNGSRNILSTSSIGFPTEIGLNAEHNYNKSFSLNDLNAMPAVNLYADDSWTFVNTSLDYSKVF